MHIDRIWKKTKTKINKNIYVRTMNEPKVKKADTQKLKQKMKKEKKINRTRIYNVERL